ncbi:12868_t:CDS:2, partial [Dentiscutata heterogama]
MNWILNLLPRRGPDIDQDFPDERELKLKIRVINYENKELCPPFQRILPNDNLDKIRNQLKNINDQRDFRMGTDHYFYGKLGKILHDEEARINLKEIIREGNVLNILQPGVDWQKLIDKCDHGFIIKNDNVEEAELKAFKINKDKIGLDSKKNLNGKDFRQEKCKNKFEELCKRNFIAGGQFSAISPWLTLFLGVSKLDKSKISEEISTEYSYTVLKKAELIIPKSSITLTEEFKSEVENALSKETTNDKIDELRKVSKKYGHFYARRIVFGGAIIEELINTETSSLKNEFNGIISKASANKIAGVSISQEADNKTKHSVNKKESFIRIIGGKRAYHDIKINKKPWFDSLEDFETWEIIEYDEVCPIFELLDGELRKKVLIALGQRILA